MVAHASHNLFGDPQKVSRPRERKGGWSWGPVEGVRLRTLSMGAGVQSTTLLFMALKGEVGPRPDVVIFADPGDEAAETYRHWDWMQGEVAKATNGQMKCLTVSKGGKLSDRIRNRASGGGSINNDRFVTIPTFMKGGGQGRRQCTREFKLDVLDKSAENLWAFPRVSGFRLCLAKVG